MVSLDVAGFYGNLCQTNIDLFKCLNGATCSVRKFPHYDEYVTDQLTSFKAVQQYLRIMHVFTCT